MARKEKISEERKKLIQEFIKSNDLKTAGDIQEAIKELFKDTIQEMLNAELTEHLGYEKNEYTEDNENYRNGYSQKTVHSTEGVQKIMKTTEMGIVKRQYIQQKEISH